MALILGDLPGVEQVELDSADYLDHAVLAGLAGREVAGLLGFFRRQTRSGRSRVKKPGMRILARNVARARSAWSGGKSRHGGGRGG
jgi:hypothetical protein